MPEYLSPGVYMEEFEIGARPIEGVSTSTAGFLGETERGPTTPRLVTSWLQFQRIYGGYFGTDKYLPGAVEGFFKNGGSRCYIARIVKSVKDDFTGASQAELNLTLENINDLKIPINKSVVLKIKAIGEGKWGNRIAVKFSSTPLNGKPLNDKIRLDILYWKSERPSETDLKDKDKDKLATVLKNQPPSISETFDNVSINETSSDYFEKTVNGISNLITIETLSTYPGSSIKLSKDPIYLCLNGGGDGGTPKNGAPADTGAVSASLKLHSIDKIDPPKYGQFLGKILKVEAIKKGKDGNNIDLKLLRGVNVIQLVIHPEDESNSVTCEGADPDGLISDFNAKGPKITEEIDIKQEPNPYKEANDAYRKSLKLIPDVSSASLTLQSIDSIDKDELSDYAGKILKVTALNQAGSDKIGIRLDIGTNGGLKLEVCPDADKPDENMEQYEGESVEDLQSMVKKSKLVEILIKNNENKEAKKLLRRVASLEGGKDSEEESTVELSDYLRTDSNTPGNRKGLTAFTEIEDISIIYAPNASIVGGLVNALISHCELLRYRFAIFDAPLSSSALSNLDPRSGKPTTDFSPTDHAAFYYPWIKVTNPETGMLQLMPPGGYIAGIYARSDNERGVHKAPANEIVKGALDLEFQIMKGEQDILNPRGVNVIRAFSGRGILVWGARTLSSNTLWKYINVRRLFIYIEASIEKGTQWVVFEPNDERLWARVKATITQFLTGVWRSGALMGTTPEEAFFVKCDRSTMTQDDIDNGRLICIIGIAPVKPAEFVIFRIAQWQGGSASTE